MSMMVDPWCARTLVVKIAMGHPSAAPLRSNDDHTHSKSTLAPANDILFHQHCFVGRVSCVFFIRCTMLLNVPGPQNIFLVKM